MCLPVDLDAPLEIRSQIVELTLHSAHPDAYDERSLSVKSFFYPGDEMQREHGDARDNRRTPV